MPAGTQGDRGVTRAPESPKKLSGKIPRGKGIPSARPTLSYYTCNLLQTKFNQISRSYKYFKKSMSQSAFSNVIYIEGLQLSVSVQAR